MSRYTELLAQGHTPEEAGEILSGLVDKGKVKETKLVDLELARKMSLSIAKTPLGFVAHKGGTPIGDYYKTAHRCAAYWGLDIKAIDEAIHPIGGGKGVNPAPYGKDGKEFHKWVRKAKARVDGGKIHAEVLLTPGQTPTAPPVVSKELQRQAMVRAKSEAKWLLRESEQNRMAAGHSHVVAGD